MIPLRIIGHLDMDAFFAAVEERDNARLRGVPLVVGADPLEGKGRGVVSTANYPAREYGIHSAMPISRAWRLSEDARRRGDPPVVFLRPDFGRYEETSERIVAILRTHISTIEQAGIDEAYLDLSFTGSYAGAETLCRGIKDEIREKERLTASVGIGPNKLIAKIASDFRKPDGLTVVEEKDAADFLAPLSIRKIPGIGPRTEIYLKDLGILTVRDLRRFTSSELQEKFGKWGLDLYEKVRGRDDSPIEERWEPKSIGEQETFLEDTRDSGVIGDHLARMCEGVFRRLSDEGFQSFRTVVLTVRFSDFETKSRSHTLPRPADSLKILHSEAMKLFLPFMDRRENPKGKRIRMIGVRVEKLAT